MLAMLQNGNPVKKRGSSSPLPPGLKRKSANQTQLEVIEESPRSSQNSSTNDDEMKLEELLIHSNQKSNRKDSKSDERVSYSPIVEEKESNSNSMPSHFGTYTLPRETY